ncbi:MAG: 23S rRNA (pseudouridine(1915)-N(3))-methyltransferase RlmH [Desulfobacterota bacterium]|jgi:23S rRNA (pseudouridine1915-N3)-methyltransferase|nr:23S rRNA (pseudouridine(1915)-N(3))-methyltransferase RlmH [Thermodesulfobacteriota bacterium]
MKFCLVTVGKIKEPFIQEGLRLYLERIARYADFQVLPVKEERLVKGASPRVIMEREAARIREKVPRNGVWLALDRLGQPADSLKLFGLLNRYADQGQPRVYFIVGGPLGLAPALLEQVDGVLSLSPLTFTHEMAALLLSEQLYRYLTVQAGEKYHK